MNGFRHLSDDELVALLKQDEMSAFEEIYHRYWAKLYSGAYKRIRSKEVAEEVVQDFFTSLWVNRATLTIQVSFAAYVFTSIRYRVFNHLQREYVRKEYCNAVQLLRTEYDNSTEEEILLNELKQTLERGVEQLPTKCRSVFELSRNQHKSTKEIAADLGISEKTVENHLTKALRVLRLNLKDYVTFLLITWFGF